jgi:hypothetical protein
MALTSRIRRPLDRTVPHLRDTRLLIIFCEGEKTEKQYFESSLFRNLRIQVKVIESQGGFSSPKHVFERMKSYIAGVDLEPNDEYWLMTDIDRWPIEQLSDVFAKAIRGKRKANLAISNPSFELWLYLHFEEWSTGNCHAEYVEKALRKLLGSYNKSRLTIELFEGNVNSAVDRAKKMCTNTNERWPSNPGTHVYKVVEAIHSVLGRN